MSTSLRPPYLPLIAATLIAACGDDQPEASASATDTVAPPITDSNPSTDSTTLVGSSGDTTPTTAGPDTTPVTDSGTSAGPTSTTATSTTTDGTTLGLTDGTTTIDPSTTTTTGDDTTTSGTTADNTTGMPCADGTLICDGNDKKVCDGMGGFKDEETCPGFCLEPVGCVLCEPGSFKCAGDIVQKCDEQGGAYGDIEACDPVQGVTCDAQAGQCAGSCAPVNIGLSYIGCDYYPTVTAGLHETNPWVFDYAVVVANTTNQVAQITITQGGNPVKMDTVNPNTAKAITLPYVAALNIPAIGTPGPTVNVPDGAYRLRSNQPVTVYQYQPLQYKVGNSFSYINDAGLLLPVNTWGLDYTVVSRNHWPFGGQNLPGFYAVVASKDNTKVTLTPSATGKIVFAGAGVAANGTGVVMLNEGDVLEVFTKSGGGSPDVSDLTGTRVEADKPVQVIGGHKCTNVPYNIQFCDRLEESIPPTSTLAKEYLVSAPLIAANNIKAEMVRIVATEDNTALVYEPAQPGAPALLAKAGDYAEIAQTKNDFQITGDKKILVAQYWIGQNGGGNSGDPAMSLAVATEQYRTQYLVHAPTNYDTSWANIIAPTGAAITVDGAAVGGFTAIGNTGFGVARIALSNGGDGNHLATGDKPFGITVYGYGQYTSYAYPGGLDLNFIPM